jgi:hypothetical protein
MRPTIITDEDIERIQGEHKARNVVMADEKHTLQGIVEPVEALVQPAPKEYNIEGMSEDDYFLMHSFKIHLTARDIRQIAEDGCLWLTQIGDDVRPFLIQTDKEFFSG